MKLTIGMIVKNEEKYLERCLTSIKPILDNVDSELIITDTGSTDRTVEISERFTDKIKHFEWINDFSAARNTTIDDARGEWYMFVDGDDIFESCDDIIRFFNSGEYRKFCSASFIYRNIINLEKNTFVDQNVIRMTARTPETKFVGKIHENLSPLAKPVRMITDVVDHYGYLYDEENPETEKVARNEKLLLEELEATPENDSRHAYLYYYLFEATRSVDTEKAEKYLKLGIENAKKYNRDVLIAMYIDEIGVYFKKGDFNSLLMLCKEYFGLEERKSGVHTTADAEMYAAKALSLSNLGIESDAVPVYLDFFRAFENMNVRTKEDADRFVISPTLASLSNYLNVFLKFLGACINENEYETADEVIVRSDLKPYSFNDTTVEHIVEAEIVLLTRIGFKNAPVYYRNLSEHGRNVFRNSLCSILYIDNQKNAIIDTLYAISGDEKKYTEKYAIYRSFFIDEAVSEDAVCSYLKTYGVEGSHDLLYIMMKCGMDITSIPFSDERDMMICVKRCFDYIYRFCSVAEEYDSRYISDVSAAPKAVKLYEYMMKCAIDTDRPIEKLIPVYADLGHRCAAAGGDDIPAEIKAAELIYNVQGDLKAKRFKECFAGIRNAVEVYPNITPVVESYQKMISEEYRKFMSNTSAEMEKLKSLLRVQVKNMVSKGQLEEAEKVINEYSKISSDENEINELRSMIK